MISLSIADGFAYNEQNENELVNPGESLWKWKTINEFAEGTL